MSILVMSNEIVVSLPAIRAGCVNDLMGMSIMSTVATIILMLFFMLFRFCEGWYVTSPRVGYFSMTTFFATVPSLLVATKK